MRNEENDYHIHDATWLFYFSILSDKLDGLQA